MSGIVISQSVNAATLLQDSSLVLIPGGWVVMGSNGGEKDERPVHKVFVDSFYIGKSEVTIGEYFECVREGKCQMPSFWNRTFFDEVHKMFSGKEWFLLPVVGVNWDDACDYCRWKGTGYRLPTEAQWEYAARGGGDTEYPWGDSDDSVHVYAAFGKRIMPVASFRPNQFGVYDMIGNVWEWCNDYYYKNYYSLSPEKNPSGPHDAKNNDYRVVRGGGWNEYKWNIRSANRNFGEQHRKYNGVGFRVCREIDR